MQEVRPNRESLQAALEQLFPRGAVDVGQCEGLAAGVLTARRG